MASTIGHKYIECRAGTREAGSDSSHVTVIIADTSQFPVLQYNTILLLMFLFCNETMVRGGDIAR